MATVKDNVITMKAGDGKSYNIHLNKDVLAGKTDEQILDLAYRDECSNISNNARGKVQKAMNSTEVGLVFVEKYPNVSITEHVAAEPKVSNMEKFVADLRTAVAEGKITKEEAKAKVDAKLKEIQDRAAKQAEAIANAI
jgi:hypothetical protein